MNTRKQLAKQILAIPNMIAQTSFTDTFKVKSMTDPDKYYTVWRTGSGLACECPNYQHRKSDCRHIKTILEIIKQNRYVLQITNLKSWNVQS